ncbi:MAG: SpoIIE family protein phosphatase [Prevotella sp.]|nr:SpoIIE family protein phosphatase [Prevotella sp.]
MQEEQQDVRRQFTKNGRRTGLAFVILAAVLLEAIAALQYYYTRNVLESNLEKQVLIMLRSSAMRLDGNLNAIVGQATNQIWHAQQRLDNPEYMARMVGDLVKHGNLKLQGAAVAFRENYYPDKGRWFEPYGHWQGDSVVVDQIGSASHDYLQMEFYKQAINGDTLKWSLPYMDEIGGASEVVTYSLPLRDASGETVAVLGIDVTTGWISNTLTGIRLHPSSYTLVLTEEGVVVSAPADSICSKAQAKKIAAMINDPAVEKEEESGGHVHSFKFYDEQNGQPAHVYFARKKHQPKWMMVTVVHDNEAYGALETMQRNIFWATLVGLLVLGLIITLFARNGRKLQESLMQQQRTERELQIANGIQQALLPLDEPSLRGVGEVEVEGRLIPAREVGGDLYNVFMRDDKLFFCIGDVSGKGVPAALIMAVIQTLFHNVASQESNPARIMERLNVTACRNNPTEIFVTLFIGVLDIKTGQLSYCNAGHERPLLAGKPLDAMPNMAIGVLDDFEYEMQQTTIEAGDTICLYTDGLTEALNAQHKLFGRQRAMQLIARLNNMPPKTMVDTIVSEVKQYAGHTEQSDDLTLLAISYRPTH